MKVGDYVRTKRGTFDRFITSHTQDNLTWYTFEDRGNITNPENYVIKSSPNIIDLIEVGDYVNGELITRVEPQDICGEEVLDNQHIYTGELAHNTKIYEYEIKSIVTKEQFENMKYKVKE